MNIFLELASGFCGFSGFHNRNNRNNRTYIFTTSATCRFYISRVFLCFSLFTFQFFIPLAEVALEYEQAE